MLTGRGLLTLFAAALLCLAAGAPAAAPAADKDADKDGGKVTGILFAFKPGEWITVKADGEDEPVKYAVGSDKKVTDAIGKTVFNAMRVTLTWKKDGDMRVLTAISKQFQPSSRPMTFTGTVVKVYDNWWVELKPKTGPTDAFAPGATFKDKEFMERFKALQPGDEVTITYTTDYERHRILTLKKK
jgi:hypothetical protein